MEHFLRQQITKPTLVEIHQNTLINIFTQKTATLS